MMLTSLCTEYYQFILCQGILLGMSCGLVFAPALSVIGHYFYKKRAMAMALASTGSPLGGIVYPVILNNLISSIGFGWAQRVCGFLSLFLLAIAAVSLRPSGMRRKGNFILLDAFRNPTYSLQVAAMFMVILGLWTPYFYLANYGLAHGMSANLAGYLFALINAGSFLGRILGGLLANHVGQFNVVIAACYLSPFLLFCWLAISSSAGLVVFAVLFGAVSGAIIALMMPLFAHTADHPSKVSHRSCTMFPHHLTSYRLALTSDNQPSWSVSRVSSARPSLAPSSPTIKGTLTVSYLVPLLRWSVLFL